MGVSNTPSSETRERSRSRGAEESPVPIIDISALSGDDAAGRRSVAQEIGRACEKIGFFVVVNHGIPQEVVDNAWNKTLAFFDMPLDEKKKFISEDESKNPYGRLSGSAFCHSGSVDLCSLTAMHVQAETPASTEAIPSWAASSCPEERR